MGLLQALAVVAGPGCSSTSSSFIHLKAWPVLPTGLPHPAPTTSYNTRSSRSKLTLARSKNGLRVAAFHIPSVVLPLPSSIPLVVIFLRSKSRVNNTGLRAEQRYSHTAQSKQSARLGLFTPGFLFLIRLNLNASNPAQVVSAVQREGALTSVPLLPPEL